MDHIRLPKYMLDHKDQAVELLDQFLTQKVKSFQPISQEIYDMGQGIHQYVNRGGKFARSLLSRIMYEDSGNEVSDEVAKALLSVELVHKFILIHDDIIDHDLMRYGGPTMEKMYQDEAGKKFTPAPAFYGKAMAIVAGDVLHSLALELVTTTALDEKIKLAYLNAVNQLMYETSAGWAMQYNQNFIPLSEITEKDIINSTKLVTAQYTLVWPLRLGQILSGRTKQEEWDPAIEAYAINLGIAFQIYDDILGVFGDSEKTGKPSGNDLIEGKRTLLVKKAFDQAGQEGKHLLMTIGSPLTTGQIDSIKRVITKTGALDYARSQAEAYAGKAKKYLDTYPNPKTKQLLVDLADYIITREK